MASNWSELLSEPERRRVLRETGTSCSANPNATSNMARDQNELLGRQHQPNADADAWNRGNRTILQVRNARQTRTRGRVGRERCRGRPGPDASRSQVQTARAPGRGAEAVDRSPSAESRRSPDIAAAPLGRRSRNQPPPAHQSQTQSRAAPPTSLPPPSASGVKRPTQTRPSA